MSLRLFLSVSFVVARLWVMVGLGVVASCKHPSPSLLRPSVVLITIDTLRPDRLGCYGHPANRTPAIDRLASEGTLFEVAYCDMPWTTGSMASVMTGMYGSGHGVQLAYHRLRPEAVTLAEILSANGYQTGAVIGSFPLDSVYGLDQGFETYDDEFSLPIFRIPGRPVKKVESRLDEDPAKQSEFVLQKLLNDAYRPDEAVTDAAIRWLERTRDGRPFFLWVHYFGPHEKTHWDQTFTAQVPEIIAAYDPEVEAADRAVGRLLDRLRSLGLLDVALVVLHSDHGQSLGEHDYVGHSLDLYDVSVRIPLIVRFPGRFPAGTRRRELVRNVDVFPTILDVVGIDGPRPGAGRSFVEPPGRAPGARTPDRSEVAYFETYTSALVPDRTVTAVAGIGRVLGPVIKTGLRTAQWKVIVGRFTAGCSTGDEMARDPSGRYYFLKPVAVDEHRCRAIEAVELYPAAIAEEPASNIAAREPEVTAELKDLLAVLSAPGPYVRDEFRPSPEQAEKLRSLGYLQ